MDIDTCILNSWILYSLRELLGTQVVRNRLLKIVYSKKPNIVIGKTFGSESSYKDLGTYVKKILNNKTKKLYFFTSSNLSSDYRGEFQTHYQTFVLDKMNKKLYAYDPSYDARSDKSLYKTIATDFLNNLVEKYGYTTYKISPGEAMQISKQDVFCQTWSLMVQGQIKFDPETFDIDIPLYSAVKNQSDRYKILLEFYKAILSIKLNCKDFKEIFKENVVDQTEEIKSIDPCKYVLETMNYIDFFPC